jgi:hypothetical protein
MDRRELLGVLGAGTVGLATLARGEASAQEAHKGHQHDKMHEDCMKACGECAKSCNETANHCLEQLRDGTGDRKIHARVHQLTMDCQEFCTFSAALIARGSPLMEYECNACAEACRICAAACDQHPAAEIVKACAEKCRTCERSCRDMVKSMRGRNT